MLNSSCCSEGGHPTPMGWLNTPPSKRQLPQRNLPGNSGDRSVEAINKLKLLQGIRPHDSSYRLVKKIHQSLAVIGSEAKQLHRWAG